MNMERDIEQGCSEKPRRLYERHAGKKVDCNGSERGFDEDDDDLRINDDDAIEDMESSIYYEEEMITFSTDNHSREDEVDAATPIRRLHRRTRSTSDMLVQRINIPGTPVTRSHYYSSLPESPAAVFLSHFAMIDDDDSESGRLDYSKGTEVAGYLLGDVVGRGTFSECREATKLKTMERVAMKIIQPMQSESSEVMMECSREVSVWRRLRHENILPLLDCMFIDGSCVCVMPICGFGNLRDYIQAHGSLDEQLAKRIFKMLCSAVHHLHNDAKLVHRDIKLENILLDDNMRAYLSDFGLAEPYTEKDEQIEYKGTPEYISPELINKTTPVDLRKVDIWALGICLYAMVCGELPFHHEFTPKLYQNIVTRQLPPLPQQFSPDLHAMVGELLDKDPSRRPLTDTLLRSRWLR